MFGFNLFVLSVIALVVIFALLGVRKVQQGTEELVERFGRYTRTLKPGLNLIIPIIERAPYVINMREQVRNIPSLSAFSKDNSSIQVDGVVYFQVINSSKSKYEVNNLEMALENLATTNIRSIVGSMELDELLSKRDDINVRLLEVLDNAVNAWGIKVTRVELKELTPPSHVVEAMSHQLKSERAARAMRLEAEGMRKSQILKAEGEKQSRILKAEGEREAAYKEAEARERLAEAEAKATKMVSDSIANGDVQAINYFVATKYVEAMKSIGTADNQKVLFMPMETSGVIGSIAGIAELAKDTFAKPKKEGRG